MPVAVDAERSARTSTLSNADAPEVEAIARGLLGVAGGRMDDPVWVAAVRREAERLPLAMRHTLRAYRRHSGGAGALVLRGLPIGADTIPDTPRADGSIQRIASVPAAILMLTACGLGEPAAFRPEKSGALVQDVVPVPGKEDFQGNAGSVKLTFHNENAFHPHRPDHVLLLCLRADHDEIAGLRLACVREILPLLPDETREALSRPEFVTAAPPSFGGGSEAAPPHPVLSGASDDPDLQVDMAATHALTARAADALRVLDDAFEALAHTTHLHPGDLAVVDNRVTVHGRTAFRPRYDGRDRWLQRTFVLTDLRRSRACRPGDGYVLHGAASW